MDNNLSTFVIPAYIKSDTYLNFLDETIQGLLVQTDDNWNAIIIDDCSPVRRVKELIDKYQDKRINYISLEERKTTGMCRNIGIKWAVENGASYILYNDADDISDCNRVKWVKDVFHKNQNADVIYSPVRVIDEFSKEVDFDSISPAIKEILCELKKNPPFGSDCWLDIGLRTGYINVTSATSVRVDLAMKELFPDEYISEDSHTWFRYGASGEYYFTNNIHASYRIPTFVKRQSSESYVKDFNVNKIRVEKDGFFKAINIAIQKGHIQEEKRSIIEFKFLMRLIESMGKVGRLDLAFKLAMECNEIIKFSYKHSTSLTNRKRCKAISDKYIEIVDI